MKEFRTLTLLATALALVLMAGCSRRGPANVVLITMDTTRADYIGCYGAKTAKTPALDSVAADGAMFTNDTTAAIATTPSHNSILSSKYSIEHGVRDNKTRQPRDLVTLPKIFKENGYVTAAFVSALPVGKSLGFDQGFDFFDDSFDPEMNAAERRAGDTTASALEWLEKNGGKPFFVWIHYYDPHGAYNPPSEFRNIFHDVDDYLGKCENPLNDRQTARKQRERRAPHYDEAAPDDPNALIPRNRPKPGGACLVPLEEAAPVQTALYAGEIAYMDGQIGKLIGWFKKRRLYRNTLFVLTADHGETLDEKNHGRNYSHGLIFEEVAKVPLIVKLPGRHPRRVVADEPVTSIDILPTMVEKLELKIPEDAAFSGKSILALAMKKDSAEFKDRPIFHESPANLAASVKLSGLKYVYIYYPRKYFKHSDHRPPEQLFDLKKDPGERSNLANTGDEIRFRDLMKLLKEWREKKYRENINKPKRELKDKKFLQKLKELGYI